MPLPPDYIWLPVEVLSRVVSYNINPDAAPLKAHSTQCDTFIAPDIDPVHLWSNPFSRRCALDALRAAKLVKLEYIGPPRYAPFYYCTVMTFSPSAPGILPYPLLTAGAVHSAEATITVTHPDFPRSASTTHPSVVTMSEFATYMLRIANYSYVSPPAFLEDTPDGLVGRDVRFSVDAVAYWRPISFDVQDGNKFVGKDVVESGLLAAISPLAPLLSIDKGPNGEARSHASMPLASDRTRKMCRTLGSNSCMMETTFLSWFSYRVKFFHMDFADMRTLYDLVVRDVTDMDDPVVRDLRPWGLLESHIASSRLYRLHVAVSDPAIVRLGDRLGRILFQTAAVISMLRWRHDLVGVISLGRTPRCGWASCPCSLVSDDDGLVDISDDTLENDTFPDWFAMDRRSWHRVQHQVLLNHRIVRNPSRGDVARCINDLTRTALRLGKYKDADRTQADPLDTDLRNDIISLTDVVRRWKEGEWQEEDGTYDDHEGGEVGSRREYILSRMSRANLPYSLNCRYTINSTEAVEAICLPFR